MRALIVATLLLGCSIPLLAQDLNTTLLEKVKANHLDSVKLLIDLGADVNYQDNNQATVLMWATYKADLEMVQYLVKHDADPKLKGAVYIDTSGSYYGNLLGIAAGEGKMDLLEYFLDSLRIPVDDREWNPTTGAKDGWTALHWAASRGQTQSCNKLLEHNANINVNQTADQSSPLLCSMHGEHYETSEFLLSMGADATLTNISGWKAMHYAARNGEIALLERILDSDPEIEAKTFPDGFTPLILAAYNNSIEACSLLLTNGAKLKEKDFNGFTALDWAKNEGFRNITKYLANPSKHSDIYLLMGWEELHIKFKKEFHQKAHSKALRLELSYVESAKREFGKSHIAYSITLNNLAMAYQTVGKYQRALPLYLEALKHHPRNEEHLYYSYQYNLASLYNLTGDYKSALLLFTEVLYFIEKNSGKTDPEYGTCLSNLAGVYLDLGLYRKGLLTYQQALKNCDHNYGKYNDKYIIRLKGEASAYFQLGSYQKAHSIYNEALKICKNTLGENHSHYGSILNGMGHVYKMTGEYERAVELYKMGLEVVKNSLGTEHPDHGVCLNNLAGMYGILGRYELALKMYQESLQNCEMNFGKAHPTYIIRLSNFADQLSSMGNYKNALLLYDEVLENSLALLGGNHPTYGIMLNSHASIYMELGNYNQALKLTLRSLQVIEKTHPREHPASMKTRNVLGILYSELGQYEKSISTYKHLLKDCENKLGKSHPDFGLYLSNMASTYLSMGLYEQSFQNCEEALMNCEKNFGRTHPVYANRLNGIANLYQLLGQYNQAIEVLQEALDICENSLGTSHPTFAIRLMALAGVYDFIGNYEASISLYEKSLAITELRLGRQHFQYGQCLNGLAIAYQQSGDFPKALSIFQEVLENLGSSLGKDHLYYATSLANLAGLYQDMERYVEAQILYEEALSILKSILGNEHPTYLIFLTNLSLLEERCGEREKAIQTSLNVNKLQLKLIQAHFDFLIDEEKTPYLRDPKDRFSANQSFSYRNSSFALQLNKIIFDNELFLKGIILNSRKDMAFQIVRTGRLEDSLLYEHWFTSKRRISTQYMMPINQRDSDLTQWESTADSIERELVKRSSVFAREQQKKEINWLQVRAQLRFDEVAIEFSHFNYYNKEWTDSTLYVAYLLKHDSEYPEMVYLFEEKELDTLTQYSHPDMLYGNRGIDELRRPSGKRVPGQLYEAIWSNLEPHLDGIETIYFAPSGKLHQVSFAALADNSGKLLSDQYNLVRLSSTGKLVVSAPEPEPSPALFMGGIDYSFDTTDQSTGDSFVQVYNPLAMAQNRGATDRSSIQYLHGSRTEVDTLFELYQSNTLPATQAWQSSASEDRVKALSGKSPKVLHIATHGFFFEDPENQHKDFGQLQGPSTFTLADDPLFRSGLLMAGANYAWEHGQNPHTKEDGILTAYEISHLDLSQTDLVVLSACETGLGDIEGSEGVYGLQRAFRMAGVDYLIMSLWQVPDAETMEFMQLFYTTWLADKSIREAFTLTQREMAKKYRAKPQKWAGFILVE